MRVIAGTYRGQRLKAPPGVRTRPTADRVREALFSILGNVEDLRVADLFAGSGALGIEALSRAYDHVIIDAGAAQSILSERIARLAPCALLVAGATAPEKAEAVREHLAQSGFTDIAVFAGTPPALEADGMRGVAA